MNAVLSHFFGVVCLILLLNDGFAACLSPLEIKQLWNDAYSDLRDSRKIVYNSNVSSFPPTRAYITSNENHYYTVAPSLSTEEADVHIGFGTLINYNLIGARKGKTDPDTHLEVPRSSIIGDISPEVVVTLLNFWRTIWLASESPEEWLSHVASVPHPESSTVEDLFDWIQSKASFSESVDLHADQSSSSSSKRISLPLTPELALLQTKLDQLVQEKKITPFASRFTITFLQQRLEECPSLYQSKDLEKDFEENIVRLYDIREEQKYVTKKVTDAYELIHKPAILTSVVFALDKVRFKKDLDMISEYSKKVSFLHNPDNFKRVRNLFLADQDYYAITDLYDPKFWATISQFVQEQNKTVTDVYTSCILTKQQSCSKSCQAGTCDQTINQHIRNLPGDKKFHYLSGCSLRPQQFTVELLFN